MPLGVGVSQPGSEAGGHRLISVCSFYKPGWLKWAAEKIRILSFSFFFCSLSHFLWLIHSVFFFFCPSLSFHTHSVSHKVRCGVYPASHCSTPPALLPSSASPRSVSLYLYHPPTSPFLVSHIASLLVSFSPTSFLTPLVSLFEMSLSLFCPSAVSY